jgi:multiple sugar transport system ATP-binding protein
VEAMTLGDRLAVMNDGRILQVGTPLDLYNQPADKFVAAFLGSPAMNFIDGEIKGDALETPIATIPIPERFKAAIAAGNGSRFTLGVRPEDIHLKVAGEAASRFFGIQMVVDVAEPLGNESIFHMRCGDHLIVAREPADCDVRAGDNVSAYLDLDRIHLFDSSSEKALAR